MAPKSKSNEPLSIFLKPKALTLAALLTLSGVEATYTYAQTPSKSPSKNYIFNTFNFEGTAFKGLLNHGAQSVSFSQTSGGQCSLEIKSTEKENDNKVGRQGIKLVSTAHSETNESRKSKSSCNHLALLFSLLDKKQVLVNFALGSLLKVPKNYNNYEKYSEELMIQEPSAVILMLPSYDEITLEDYDAEFEKYKNSVSKYKEISVNYSKKKASLDHLTESSRLEVLNNLPLLMRDRLILLDQILAYERQLSIAPNELRKIGH